MREKGPIGDPQGDGKKRRWSFRKERALPRVVAEPLTEDYLKARVAKQLAPIIDRFPIEKQESVRDAVGSFVEHQATGVRVNGVDVLSVDFDHDEEEVGPITRGLIGSPQTGPVVSEYFTPDMGSGADMYKSGSRVLDKINGARDYTSRLAYADDLADVCAEEGKTVVVADIANKSSYVLTRELFRVAPGFVLYKGTELLPDEIFQNINAVTGLPPRLQEIATALLCIGLWSGPLVYQIQKRKGMFNPEKVTQLDRMVLDFEQARRLYWAKGIEQLTSDIQQNTPEGEDPKQVVFLNQRAHTLRVDDMILNPNEGYNKFRSGVYKAVGTLGRLDFSVRTWEHGEDGWEKTGSSKITI
jgi:hypothetical protein